MILPFHLLMTFDWKLVFKVDWLVILHRKDFLLRARSLLSLGFSEQSHISSLAESEVCRCRSIVDAINLMKQVDCLVIVQGKIFDMHGVIDCRVCSFSSAIVFSLKRHRLQKQ